MNRLEDYEREFIRETYTDPDWSCASIAEKIGRSKSTVMLYAKRMSLTGESNHRRGAFHDWPSIWYAHQANQSYRETGRRLGISGMAVCYAINRMILMGTQERLKLWNRYAEKVGREPYTWQDANGII